MRFYYTPDRAPYTVDNIVVLSVTRPKNFRQAQSAGRVQHTFLLTVRGQMRYELAEQVIIADAGELVFLPLGCVHTSIYAENPTEVRIVQFSLAKGSLPDYLSCPSKLALPDAALLMEPFFLEEKNAARMHPFWCLAKMYELLWHIDSRRDVPPKFCSLEPALREIRQNFADDCTVAEYAALCSLSESGFRRLFVEYAGQSPVAFRNDIRLHEAKILIESGECNVSEAAMRVGFTNSSFFNRLFLRKYGHSPTWR